MGLKITKIGITNDKISARGGLTLFLRYFEKIGGYNLLSSTISEKIRYTEQPYVQYYITSIIYLAFKN